MEPDASWCEPGGTPASPCANGGAFGGKLRSPVGADARRLADEHGRAVRVLWSREDVVRWGPKRPPVGAGIARDGTGVLRVGVTGDGFAAADWDALVDRVAVVAPGMTLEQVVVDGPPVASDPRAAVWAEAAALDLAVRLAGGGPRTPVVDVPVEVVAPSGGRSVVRCLADGSLLVEVDAGAPLDETVLRSYALGAAHQALGLVGSEGIAVDASGAVSDLTVRSFGILPARATPPVTVTVGGDPGRPAGAGRPTRCSPRSPLRAGWPTDCPGSGPPTGGQRADGPPRRPRRLADHPQVPRGAAMSTPVGPYTPIVRAGPWLICSGQLGLCPASDGAPPALAEGGAGPQLTQAVANAAALLATEGASLADVVKTTVFALRPEDFTAVNEAYTAAFGDHRPARSMVAVSALPMGAAVEIEVWAHREAALIPKGALADAGQGDQLVCPKR